MTQTLQQGKASEVRYTIYYETENGIVELDLTEEEVMMMGGVIPFPHGAVYSGGEGDAQ